MDGPHYGHNGIYWASRDIGPVVISQDGCVYFSQTHNGPTVIEPEGSVMYQFNNRIHRTTGPAVIYADGEGEYWVNGIKLTQLEFFTTYGVM